MCFEQAHPHSLLSDSSHAHPPHFRPNAIHAFQMRVSPLTAAGLCMGVGLSPGMQTAYLKKTDSDCKL